MTTTLTKEEVRKQVGYVVTIVSKLKVDNREDRDDWYKKYNNYFSSISPLISEDETPDVVSTQDIKSNEDCYVVWVEYTTGDSMGRCDGNYEAFAVFKDEQSALAFQNTLENANSELPFCYSADGCEIKDMTLPWEDYHSRLRTVHISQAVMY